MTRYEFFRKRIAPVLFLGMVGLIAYDSCDRERRARTVLEFELGDARPQVTHVDAELIASSEVIGRFHKEALPGAVIGNCQFEASLPDDQLVTLNIRVGLRGGERAITRTIRPLEDAKTTIDLARELR